MTSRNLILTSGLLAACMWVSLGDIPVHARPSAGRVGGGGMGGGGRGGGGRVGGGGMSRPAPRPSGPSMQRPTMSHPSVSRPAPNVSRPAPRPSTPSFGGMHGSSRPSGFQPPTAGTTRPGTPSVGTRPAIKPPSGLKPATRPGDSIVANRPNIDRPGTGGKPGIITPGANTRPPRPSIGDLNRPTTLPGNVGRPSIGDRPGIGDLNRPTTLPGNVGRPGIGGRPGPGDRPIIGGNRPGDRPIIGGGNNIIGGGNTVIGGGNTIVNRPGGNININRPGWGYGHGDWGHGGWGSGWHGNWNNNWHDHWYGHHIHNHYHGWYHGCWAGARWYAPIAYGVPIWGYASLTGWGLGVPYYNPYYDAMASAGYDYSQPIVVNNYVTADADAAPAAAPADPTLTLVDEARDLFQRSQYRDALRKLDTAARKQPGDPVVHELSALCYFALGDYRRAAAALNALLTSAPGMDWTTMSTLYPNADDYTKQLRRLESHCKSKPDDAAGAFVLAYHYLVLGETDAAINALRVVVRQQPKDTTAKRMLDALAPPEEEAPPAPPPAKPAPAAKPAADEPAEAAAEQTDLVGSWRAKGGDTTIELAIDEKFGFVWKATPKDSPAVELTGQVIATNDTLVLDAQDKGTMVGQVKSAGADKFEFRLIGMPPSEPSLAFVRAK